MKIKSLEWVCGADRNIWTAPKPLSYGKHYKIVEEDGKFFALWDNSIPGSDSLKELQDIAQKEFEAEIMSVFET